MRGIPNAWTFPFRLPAVLRTLREVSEKNEQLVTALEDAHAEIVVNENRIQCAFILNQAIEAYKEGKKDE